MELKKWVKAAREHKKLTIEQLGTALGRSKAAAGFWETGATKPSYAQIKKISEVTGWPMPDSEIASAANQSGALETGEAVATYAVPNVADARRDRWPFPRVDFDKLVALQGIDARNLENALLAAAGDLDLDIRVARSGKRKAA